MSISRIAALFTALALCACSQKYSFDDWPDASHLLVEEELPASVSEQLSQGMRAADDFLRAFLIGGPEEDDYATPESLPPYVQEARSRFLTWHRGEREGLESMEPYAGVVAFAVVNEADLAMLLQLYQDQPEVREAWFHLAQVHWNQGTEVLHDVVPVAIWKALAKDESVTLEARQEWIRKYPLDRRAIYLRMAKGMQDWMGFWPTASRERLAQRFPEGLPTEENQRLVEMMEKLLAAPVPGHGEPGLSAEDLAWLKTTECYQDLKPSMLYLGDDPWLPWMVPEDGK